MLKRGRTIQWGLGKHIIVFGSLGALFCIRGSRHVYRGFTGRCSMLNISYREIDVNSASGRIFFIDTGHSFSRRLCLKRE